MQIHEEHTAKHPITIHHSKKRISATAKETLSADTLHNGNYNYLQTKQTSDKMSASPAAVKKAEAFRKAEAERKAAAAKAAAAKGKKGQEQNAKEKPQPKRN
jgi:hypothetical protein